MPLLDVRSVHKSFGGVRAVDGCSFTVAEGQIVGLIGPNGAGKSTLFHIVSGFLKPDAGEVWFAGRRIDPLRPHEVFHLGLARTFQLTRELRRMTVLENLMLVPPYQAGERLWGAWFAPGRVEQEEEAIACRAEEVLEVVELGHLKHECAGNLSGGQKKLLELARTLMARPRLVLLDEVGAGVNRGLLGRLVDCIRELRQQGISFLLVEHDMELVSSLCDVVVVMHHGQKLAEGPPEVIRRDPQVLEAYLGA